MPPARLTLTKQKYNVSLMTKLTTRATINFANAKKNDAFGEQAMPSKSALLMTSAMCAAAALTGPAPAIAQDRDAVTTSEVIVTAQRRAERLEDVPISVTALSGAQLEDRGVANTNDLTTVTPGLTMSETASFVQPFIRGVGSLTTNLGDQGSVATYIDGVYMPLVQTAIYDLANVSDIEVLKGPQGTLFGRNTSGGAILITTKHPEDAFGGEAEASYGNYNAWAFRGYVTGPIANGVSASLAGNYSRHDGWVDDLFLNRRIGDAERYGIRGTVLIEPNSRLSVTLNGDYEHTDDPNGVLIHPIGGYLGLTPTSLTPKGDYDYVGNVTDSQQSEQYGGSARIVYHFGAFDLISLTAGRFFKTQVVFDSDGSPIPVIELQDTEQGRVISQEVQLQSTKSGPFHWIVGGFYYNQESSYAPLNVLIGTMTTLHITADHGDEAYAGFADGTYTFGRFELTAGARYNTETKKVTALLGGAPVINGAQATWTSVTPRAVLSYKPSNKLLAYFSYSQGYKSGAFNVSGLSSVPVSPEKVNAYELGIKWQAGQTLTFNAAAYLYDTSNLQVQTIDPTDGLQLLANAAQSRSKGVDVDLTWRPIDRLHVQIGASYLDAQYTNFPNAQVYVPAGGPSAGFITVPEDVSGNEVVRSPKWTFNLAADYSFMLPDGGRIVPSVNFFTSSAFYWDFGNRLKQDPYTMLNTEVSWRLPGGKLSFSLWGRNMLDARVYRSYTTTAASDQGVFGDPRTYGVRVGYKF
jgi:iron complex outermembrane recepter protein